MNPRKEVWLAWSFLAISIAMYPVSMLTFARHEPPTILGISFLAIWLQCLEYIKSSRIHKQQQKESDTSKESHGVEAI